MGGIYGNGSDPICSQLPAWHLPRSPARRHNGYPAKGEAKICSIQVSCHGNQPDGKSQARPRAGTAHTAKYRSSVQGPRRTSCLERETKSFGGGKERRASFAS